MMTLPPRPRTALAGLLLSLLLLGAAGPRAADDPLLQLDPGGHLALIRAIAFTPDGRQLVSASDDKTLRVWDLASGRTLRTLRGQIGPGDEGKVYAMALSPDGRWLAAGGWMKAGEQGDYGDIRLYDFRSGALKALLKGHSNVVYALAFSPDGRRLVSGGGDFNAIIWDLDRRQPAQRLAGHTDDIYAVAFTPDGARVVTGSYDQTLRLWRVADGGLIATLAGHSDKVRAVAVAPDGTIASGSWDHTIRLWDGRTGRFLRTLADPGTQVGALAFSPDGRYLLSGVSAYPDHCHVYEVKSGRAVVTYRGHDSIVLAAAVSPDGRRAATGGGQDQSIQLWDLRTGQPRQTLKGTGSAVWAVGFSADGGRLLWGKTWKRNDPAKGYGDLDYQLPLPAPRQALTGPAPFTGGPTRRALAEQGGWSLVHRPGGHYGYDDAILEILHKGRTEARIERDATDGLGHSSYSFTPDGRTLVSGGGNGFLTAYDRGGNTLGAFVGHTGDVWAVAVSPDGRLLASGADDQTVRLWNLKTRENLLTLFQGSDGEWVAWTPAGYYAASPGGDDLIGWQLNRGADRTPDYYPAGRFRQGRYRPELVAEVIRRGSEAAALAAWRNERRGVRPDTLAQAIARLPDPPRLLSGPTGTVHAPEQRLRLALDPRAERLVLTLNGRPTRGTGRVREREVDETVTLSPGENRLQAIARNAQGESAPLAWGVTYTPSVAPDAWRKPALYVLAVGVSDYRDDGLDLRYARQDAEGLAARLQGEAGGLYRTVRVKTLTDRAATRANILDALGFLEQMTQDDLALLFLAGHGQPDPKGSFYFLPADADDARLRATAIRWDQFQDLVAGLPGKVLLWADACHSAGIAGGRVTRGRGRIDMTELAREFADVATGVLVLTSSTGRELSEESPQWRHGAFTQALLEGLGGEADFDRDGVIHRSELETYVKRRVVKLTDGRQHPIAAGAAIADFALARAP